MPTASPSLVTIVEELDYAVEANRLCAAIAGLDHCAVLESSNPSLAYGRYSIYAADPLQVVSIPPEGGRAIDILADRVRASRLPMEPTHELPFVGGWIGFLTYEAGLQIERIGSAHTPEHALPLAMFGLYDTAIVHDRAKDRWYVVATDAESLQHTNGVTQEGFRVLQHTGERPSAQARVKCWIEWLSRLNTKPAPRAPTSSVVSTSMTRSAYESAVARAKAYIEEGDIYQVNLSQRFACRTDKSPFDLYQRLQDLSPASHAALLRWNDTAVISASPELFLDLRNDRVLTRPIKGTRPRAGDEVRDAHARLELADSEKERAELNMIVDLLRNDLGRVCEFGSVRVLDAGCIEEHPTVFHRVATIEGRLRPGCDAFDLLRASFPGGSITGAPKIRAMRIIDELEPSARGVYCGSIGYVGLDGSMQMNIAIRTMVQVGDVVSACAGGAITADSDPDAEYMEIMAKATAMLRAMNCAVPSGVS